MILPVFRDMVTPEIALSILEYSPLPTKVVEQFKKIAAKPDPDAEAHRQIGQQAAIAKVEKDKAAAAKDMATAPQIASGAGNPPPDHADTIHKLAQADADKARTEAARSSARLNDIKAAKEVVMPVVPPVPGPRQV